MTTSTIFLLRAAPEASSRWRARAGRAAAMAVALSVLAGAATAQLPVGARIVVIAPGEGDARIERAREAVEFWNRAFENLELDGALQVTEVRVAPPELRSFENYAWQVSRRAGRRAAGPLEPSPPAALRALDADVVVLLSAQDLMPFAWPLAGRPRYLVAVDAASPADGDGVVRVIAHELGHALGLRHDRGNAAALMCMPCSRSPATTPPPLVLGPREEARLRELYAAAPGAAPLTPEPP